MADIDLLVPENQLEATHALLLSHGYTPRPTPGREAFHLPVGTRSTRVPDFLRESWGRGGTRPYPIHGR
jgi:hypothetical protein